MASDGGPWRSTDSRLVGSARDGDASAFHELVDRYAGFLFALALSLSGNAADAEDLVQETFSGAFRGLAAFEGRASVKTWLARILIRQSGRRLRYAHRRQAVALPLGATAEPEAGGSSPQARAEARIDVTAAIGSLSAEHQQVIVLREMQGLSYDEMAEVLEIPRGTVESRLFRARRELRERLKDYLE